MTLADYLAEANQSQAQFARAIGKPRQTVHRYLTGERRPDMRTLGKIALATGGRVTANDFFGMAA